MSSGLVFNIQRYSLHDGPGIRTTVFLKGCSLRCAWCHNPEGMDAEPEILRTPMRCISCGWCREVCPERGAGPVREQIEGNGDSPECTHCGACAEACPAEARRLVGRRMTETEVMTEVRRDRIFHEESGGGVTFSGGEPLLQPDFLMSMLEACRQREIHTAIDTSGHVPQATLLAAAHRADLFLYDVKMLDDDQHRHYTGVSNQLILDNLQVLGRVHRNIWVRMPLVPGVNDDRQHIEGVVRLAASTPGVRQVNLLPYHATGVPKFARLGKEYSGPAVGPPAETAEQTAARLQHLGVHVLSGG